jgi:hypothetical protein
MELRYYTPEMHVRLSVSFLAGLLQLFQFQQYVQTPDQKRKVRVELLQTQTGIQEARNSTVVLGCSIRAASLSGEAPPTGARRRCRRSSVEMAAMRQGTSKWLLVRPKVLRRSGRG